jgi:hypothetical protein
MWMPLEQLDRKSTARILISSPVAAYAHINAQAHKVERQQTAKETK